MLKILMITGCVYAKNTGRTSFTGLDYVVGDIAEKIGTKCDLTVFTTTPYPRSSEMNNANIRSYSYLQLVPYTVKNIRNIYILLKNKKLSFIEKIKMIISLLLSDYICDLCKREQYDLISMQGVGHCNYLLSRVGYKNHIPVVFSLHGLLSFGAPNIRYIDSWTESELLKYVKQKSLTISVVSKGIQTLICNKYDINNERVHVINNAVKFRTVSNDCAGVIKEESDEIKIISVGTLNKNKNQIQLLRAFTLLPESIKKKCKITLVGKDDTNGEIENYIAENALENIVTVCGFLSKDDVAKLYIDSTFNVMLSISEGFGLSMIEAAYFGIPTLTFDDLDAAHDIYTEDSMILLKDRSDETVREGLLAMIEKNWDADKIHKSVKRFNEDIYFEYLELFKHISKNNDNLIDRDFAIELLEEI